MIQNHTHAIESFSKNWGIPLELAKKIYKNLSDAREYVSSIFPECDCIVRYTNTNESGILAVVVTDSKNYRYDVIRTRNGFKLRESE